MNEKRCYTADVAPFSPFHPTSVVFADSPRKRERGRGRGREVISRQNKRVERNDTDKRSPIIVVTIFGKFLEGRNVYIYIYRKERTKDRIRTMKDTKESCWKSGGEGLRLWHVTGRRGAKRRTRRRPPPGASPAAPCLSLPAFASLFLLYPVLSYPPLPFIFLLSSISFTPRPSTLASPPSTTQS